MADKRFSDGVCQEAVCVDAGRVYDSCADKDCAENLRVYFTERDQQLINCCTVARVRKVELLSTCIDVESLPFNRGYYACDLTFYFEVTVEVCCGRGQQPCTICGVASFAKKVILFGSEGSVKVFSSEFTDNGYDKQEMPSQSLPRCVVQVAEPVVLNAQVVPVCDCRDVCGCGCMPQTVLCRYGESLVDACEKALVVTLGLFSIVQLVRNVQMLMPVYDFCMPSKDCSMKCESACDAFKQMSFPVDEFFPPRQNYDNSGYMGDCGCSCSCGC